MIRGYRLEIDPAAVGLPVAAWVRIRPGPGQLPRIAELAARIPEVSQCYRISGEGEGGVAGFAKGGAKVSRADKDGGTLLSYSVEAQIGGKLAQLGQRLINGAAKKTADDFFKNFATAVTPRAV